jgi:hypothetical protein
MPPVKSKGKITRLNLKGPREGFRLPKCQGVINYLKPATHNSELWASGTPSEKFVSDRVVRIRGRNCHRTKIFSCG